MPDLSIEMREFAFRVAVQAAAEAASKSSRAPGECAASVAAGALEAAAALGLRVTAHPLGSPGSSVDAGAQ